MVTTDDSTGQFFPGKDLGLPSSGAGSVAGMGRRTGAFGIDIVLSALVAWIFTAPQPPQNWSLVVWSVLTVVTVGLFGFSPGQAALGIRVVPMSGGSFVGAWALPRTALIFLIVPPLIVNADGRGLHDRVCRTIVLRMR